MKSLLMLSLILAIACLAACSNHELTVLANLPDPPGVDDIPVLESALASDDADVRYQAELGLIKIGEPAIPALTRSLGLKLERARFNAARALAKIAKVAETPSPALVDAVPALERATSSSYRLAVYAAGEALGRIGGEEAKAALLRLLKGHGDRRTRQAAEAAIMGLAIAEPPVREAFPVLVDLLRGGEFGPDVVARAIGKTGGAEAVPILLEFAERDRDASIPRYGLEYIGPGATAAIPTLMRLLNGDSETLQGAAAIGLGSIGPAARQAVPRLKEILESKRPSSYGPDEVLFGDVLEAWVKIDGESTAPYLREILLNDSESSGHRMDAVVGLRNVGQSAYAAFSLSDLFQLLERNGLSPVVEDFVQRALQDFIPHESDLPTIQKALQSDSARIRELAAALRDKTESDHPD